MENNIYYNNMKAIINVVGGENKDWNTRIDMWKAQNNIKIAYEKERREFLEFVADKDMTKGI